MISDQIKWNATQQSLFGYAFMFFFPNDFVYDGWNVFGNVVANYMQVWQQYGVRLPANNGAQLETMKKRKSNDIKMNQLLKNCWK